MQILLMFHSTLRFDIIKPSVTGAAEVTETRNDREKTT